MELRELLEKVAAGEVAPDEALAEMGSTAPADVRRPAGVDIVASGVRLVLVADPMVATVVADGPHRIREDGDRLIVELPGEDRAGSSWNFGGLRLQFPSGGGQKVRMRVNPALPVRLELTTCDAKLSGLVADLDFDVSSSSLKVADHRGALRGRTSASSASIAAVLTRDSEISADMGSLDVALLPGSDATVTVTSEMGSAKVFGTDARTTTDNSGLRTTGRARAGAGTATVALRVRMGSLKVAVS